MQWNRLLPLSAGPLLSAFVCPRPSIPAIRPNIAHNVFSFIPSCGICRDQQKNYTTQLHEPQKLLTVLKVCETLPPFTSWSLASNSLSGPRSTCCLNPNLLSSGDPRLSQKGRKSLSVLSLPGAPHRRPNCHLLNSHPTLVVKDGQSTTWKRRPNPNDTDKDPIHSVRVMLEPIIIWPIYYRWSTWKLDQWLCNFILSKFILKYYVFGKSSTGYLAI